MSHKTPYEKRVESNARSIRQTSQSLLDQTTNEAFANTYAQLQKLRSARAKLKGMTPEQRAEMNAGLSDVYEELRKERTRSMESEKSEIGAAVAAVRSPAMQRP